MIYKSVNKVSAFYCHHNTVTEIKRETKIYFYLRKPIVHNGFLIQSHLILGVDISLIKTEYVSVCFLLQEKQNESRPVLQVKNQPFRRL